MTRFRDKHILITGGTSGIGLAGAQRIATEGGTVTLTGTTPDRLAEASREIPDATVIANDARAADAGTALAEQLDDQAALDGLWLNAGIADIAEIPDVDAAFFDRVMHANVRGPVLQLATLADRLNDGASVVLTSSTATYEGSPTAGVYAATKGALTALGRSWAGELAPRGIRVNVLVPGTIRTDFRRFMPDAVREELEDSVAEQVPLHRLGTADEAAAVALFLLSNEASYVTASQYPVDGGLTRR